MEHNALDMQVLALIEAFSPPPSPASYEECQYDGEFLLVPESDDYCDGDFVLVPRADEKNQVELVALPCPYETDDEPSELVAPPCPYDIPEQCFILPCPYQTHSLFLPAMFPDGNEEDPWPQQPFEGMYDVENLLRETVYSGDNFESVQCFDWDTYDLEGVYAD